MKIALRILALCGFLVLGACSTISNIETIATGSVTPNQVYVLANTFVVAETTATQYLNLPPCPISTGVCRTPAGVNAVYPPIRAARKAVNTLEAYVNGNPGAPVPVSLYDTAVTAVQALQSAVSQYTAQKS